MGVSPAKAIGLTLSLIIMAMLVPRGLLYLVGAQYTNITIGDSVVEWTDLDPVINTMFIVILPLIIVIGLMTYYIPKFKN